MTMTDTAEREEDARVASPDRLEALFDSHQPRLYRLARRLSRDPEESRDLVQDTFLRAARRPRSIPRDDDHAEAWLVQILVNLCRDRQRRIAVRNRPVGEDPSRATGASDPESSAVARVTVQAALARLAPRRRAICVLHELEGLTTPRVARMLGLSQATVRWHVAAARRQLMRIIQQSEPGAGERAS